jgi:serine/threonine protein kinase
MVLSMEPSPKVQRPASDDGDPQPESGAPSTEPLARRAAKPAGEATTHPHVETAAVTGRSSSPHQYEKLGEIARGGMGAILKVQDNDLRRHVAMKVMLGEDRQMRARFIEEAQVTGQLEHPGIVPVHEMGVDHDGRPYFTMKLVKGRSLAQIFRQLRDGDPEALKEFVLPRLVRILVDVANAIAFAHHKGVLHRDLKPANIMVGRFGEVLVMDWGLAKIAAKRPTAGGADGSGIAAARTVDDEPPLDPRTAGDGTTRIVSKHGTQRIARRQTPPGDDLLDQFGEDSPVTSSRSGGLADTRVGQVAGTPAYMAPEQARGDTARIDRRSDVYALGALLYESLTLSAPVRGKNAKDLIEAAKAGRIDAPEMRAPARTIPPELSAIALKALNHSQFRRYQWVEDFRRDLELYLDGRSVSAKVDSAWETLRKLMRRNRATSIAIGVLGPLILVLSVLFLVVTTQALHQEKLERRRAEEALNAVTAEQQGRKAAEQLAGPALVAQAHLQIDGGQAAEALKTIEAALRFDGEHHEAHLLRGELLAAGHDFAGAAEELDRVTQAGSTTPGVAALLALCRQGQQSGASTALDDDLATALGALGATRLAQGLAKSAPEQEALYRKALERAWPGAGARLKSIANGRFHFETGPLKDAVADLAPLRGLPLAELAISSCPQLQDLAPLAGMPLIQFDLQDCPRVADLGPLAHARLTRANLRLLPKVTDFKVLADMPLHELHLLACPQFDQLALFRELPLEMLSLGSPRVTSLAPLSGKRLTYLEITGCSGIADLAPLTGMPLGYLGAADCALLRSIAPLAGMPLKVLNLDRCPAIADLAALSGMSQLYGLHLVKLAQVEDFRPLAGLHLRDLTMTGCARFSDLAVLAGQPLEVLGITDCPLITDVTALAKLPLRKLDLNPERIQAGMEGLRSIATLGTINDLTAAAFWKKYDAAHVKTGN